MLSGISRPSLQPPIGDVRRFLYHLVVTLSGRISKRTILHFLLWYISILRGAFNNFSGQGSRKQKRNISIGYSCRQCGGETFSKQMKMTGGYSTDLYCYSWISSNNEPSWRTVSLLWRTNFRHYCYGTQINALVRRIIDSNYGTRQRVWSGASLIRTRRRGLPTVLWYRPLCGIGSSWGPIICSQWTRWIAYEYE